MEFVKKHKPIFIALGVLLATLGVTYYVLFLRKKGDNEEEGYPILTSTANRVLKATCNSSGNNQDALFPLKMDSKGRQVKQLQRYLNKAYKANLCDDGYWGENTEKAMRSAKIPASESMIYTSITPFLYEKLGLKNY